MGWLVGLPLGIFKLLFTVVMLLIRFAVPIALIVAVVLVLRRTRGGKKYGEGQEKKAKEPEFRGPVYTVDYEEVKEDAE